VLLPTSFLFSDQPYSADAGVYVFSGRAYDPKLGRFISPDEIVAVPGSPETLNRYAYGHNNPLSMIDPDGHDPFAIFVAIVLGAFLGGVKAYMEGRDWKKGALLGGLSAALLSVPDALGLDGVVRFVVSIATGAIKGGVTAALAGGNIGWSIVEGAVQGAVENAKYAELKPIEWWGSSAGSDIVAAANQLTNGALKAATYGGLRSAASDADIAEGAIKGLQDWAFKDAADVAIGHVNTLLGPMLGGTFSTTGGEFKRKEQTKSEPKPQETGQLQRSGSPERRPDGQAIPAPVIDNGGLSLGAGSAWTRQIRDRKPVTP
jgi:RHS repeat-associated protein